MLLSIKGSDFCASGHRQRWFTFNNQARMFIGGERKVKGRIDHAFHGTITGKKC